MRARKLVLWPAPWRPTRHTSSPAATSSETPRRMRLFWMSTVRPSMASMSIAPRELADPLADDGGDDVGIAEERRRRLVGEHLALLQRHDAARVFGDQVHVVLDEDDGLHTRAPGRVDDASHDAVLVAGGDAAGGLVEQDHLGRKREGAGDVEEPPLALRQQTRREREPGLEPEDGRHLAHAGVHRLVARDR